MKKELTLAFIGGGNMATALAAGLIGKRYAAGNVHVVDIDQAILDCWIQQGTSGALAPDDILAERSIWVFAVKPQHLKESIAHCRPFLRPDTLIISIAAGVQSDTIARWLGSPDQPWTRVVRCMPNTPALISSGVTGMMAMQGVTPDDKTNAQQLMRAVGEVVWLDNDRQLDAVTALSGSGPAYVYLFIEALIQGGIKLGLTDDQARTLALATLNGSTQLAALSHETPATLRERVTSKGGTTAAALAVFDQKEFTSIVQQAMQAAYERAAALAQESAK